MSGAGLGGAVLNGAPAGDRPSISREGDLFRLGVALLRDAIDPAGVQALFARAQDRFALLEGMSPQELEAHGVGQFRYHGALDLAAVDPEMRIVCALHPAVLPALCGFMDCPDLAFRNGIVRRVYPQRPEASSSFHQDLQFLKPYSGRMVTIWVPLQPCDGSRPGLEVLPRRLHALAGRTVADYLGDSPVFNPYVDRGAGVPHDSAVALSEAEVAPLAAGLPLWRPQLAVGDILIFDGYTIHRSALAPGMRLSRTSAELRCVPYVPQAGAGGPAGAGGRQG